MGDCKGIVGEEKRQEPMTPASTNLTYSFFYLPISFIILGVALTGPHIREW
jgi:hypothetical protein